ncbi:NYN domain-containing protein [Leptolyngbya sp. AN03gr2]|uniref:LabA-like NYN domain-containing protein n=1 Tax=unclassified Leptolyngbya TaxID=2650499 RepID=UPI003D3139E5
MLQTIFKQSVSDAVSNPSSHNAFTQETDERSIQKRSTQSWTAVFIDGASLYHAAQKLDIEIDYAKLLYELTKNNRFLRAFFYTCVDRTNEKQQGFVLWMRRNGYRVITRDLAQFDASKKVNLDVEIAVDMMQLVDYCEKMILVTGDGSLSYAANCVAYKGIQVEVVSLKSMLSESLLNVCDRFTDLETLKHLIQK